jgi:hypothetical protein
MGALVSRWPRLRELVSVEGCLPLRVVFGKVWIPFLFYPFPEWEALF